MHNRNNITIKSDILEEEVTEEEYRRIYDTRIGELSKIKDLMNQAKAELKEILTIGESSELKKFTEMLVKAEKLKNKEKTIGDIKKMEIEIKQQEEEIEMFTPVMKKLQSAK